MRTVRVALHACLVPMCASPHNTPGPRTLACCTRYICWSHCHPGSSWPTETQYSIHACTHHVHATRLVANQSRASTHVCVAAVSCMAVCHATSAYLVLSEQLGIKGIELSKSTEQTLLAVVSLCGSMHKHTWAHACRNATVGIACIPYA